MRVLAPATVQAVNRGASRLAFPTQSTPTFTIGVTAA